MNDLTKASSGAKEAIDMLKESVLTVLAEANESGVELRPATIRDDLGLQELNVRRPSGSWGSIQIVSVILYLLGKDECVQGRKEGNITYWKITHKGLEQLGKIQ